MESPHPSNLEDSRNAILNDGFFIVQDQLLGGNIKKMDEDAVPFASVNGLHFCKDNVLDNPVSEIPCWRDSGPNSQSAFGLSSNRSSSGLFWAFTDPSVRLLATIPSAAIRVPRRKSFSSSCGAKSPRLHTGPVHITSGWTPSKRKILCYEFLAPVSISSASGPQ
jgi:hypothetical protein